MLNKPPILCLKPSLTDHCLIKKGRNSSPPELLKDLVQFRMLRTVIRSRLLDKKTTNFKLRRWYLFSVYLVTGFSFWRSSDHRIWSRSCFYVEKRELRETKGKQKMKRKKKEKRYSSSFTASFLVSVTLVLCVCSSVIWRCMGQDNTAEEHI